MPVIFTYPGRKHGLIEEGTESEYGDAEGLGRVPPAFAAG